MKSYHLTPGTGLAGLTIREHKDPEPGPGQVLVRMRASALSYRELLVLTGDYPLPIRPDVIPGCAGAGEVVAVGAGVDRVAPGDRVAASVFPHWIDGPFAWEYAAQLGSSLDGTLTELGLFGEQGLVPIPDHLSYEEAATLPLTALTAWNALTGGRPLRAGETVLTLGTGDVSLFAVRFAKLSGARVLATTSSADRARRLRELGADEVIDYAETPAWHEAVRAHTGGRGVDHVVHVAGSLDQSVRATAIEGEVAFVGNWLGRETATPLSEATLFASAARIRPIAVGSRAQFAAMNAAVAAHDVHPSIDRVFPFAEAHAAFRYRETAGPFGSVIIAHP
ncbi:NAD(P)-dependent alcohol dehydrogenase [Embleya sp. NBC_00896]|uniref:zinc-dependent alcohol dehydrogenase family protein n=1 Tax=Embleya sp. NBC_00896 TaxID=2975961 RepID=UPI002F907CCE|nr:NAD(P)-dependent alcohol dehydrogenase [Embleya sp. NBC_00896]